MNLNPLNVKSIGKIVLKNTLKTHYSLSALVDLIVKQIREIPEHHKLKQDIELILVTCSMIEIICADSDSDVNIVNFLHQHKTFVYKMVIRSSG